MPTKPEIKRLNATSPQIVNAVRNELGGTYADVVPEIDLTASRAEINSQLRHIGEIFDTFTAQRNDFLSALINRIGRVLITSKLYENPWSGFKQGLLEFGETVEEIFVNLTKPHQFDPAVAESQIFKREIPDVRSAFHTMNYQKFYKVTISNDQLRQAFLSDTGITDLIGRIIDTLYTSANYDELITMKYLLAKLALNGNIYAMNLPAITAENSDSIVTTIKGLSNELTFMKTDYNMSGVATYSNKNDQFVIMNAMFDATIGVNSLAMAYNLEYRQFMGQTVLIDSFGFSGAEQERLNELFAEDPEYVPLTADEINRLKTIPAFIIDRNFLMIFDNFYNMTEQYNGEGLYWNYWYHAWKTFSASPFSNAILFTTETPAVTNVSVSPTTASVLKGDSLQLTSVVVTTGFAPEGVTWSVTGTSDVTSTITPQGLLKVSTTEGNTTLTVTATSNFDASKTGTATITVTSPTA